MPNTKVLIPQLPDLIIDMFAPFMGHLDSCPRINFKGTCTCGCSRLIDTDGSSPLELALTELSKLLTDDITERLAALQQNNRISE